MVRNMYLGLKTLMLLVLTGSVWAEEPDFRTIESEITFIQGDIELLDGRAIAHVSARFEYLDAFDATRVLEAKSLPIPQGLLGIIIPADSSPFEKDSWMAFIRYVESGHIGGDGLSATPADLLLEKRRILAVQNQGNRVQGMNTTEHLGWVVQPTYSSADQRLSWSQKLQAGESSIVQHDIVTLGRNGYLTVQASVDGDDDVVARYLPDLNRLLKFADGYRHENVSDDDIRADFSLQSLVTGNYASESRFVSALASISGTGANRILLTVLIVLLVIVLVRQHSSTKTQSVRRLNTKKARS
ncbi:MAG: DUF2167 domain-containing protein [Pseudomonadota bacterium]